MPMPKGKDEVVFFPGNFRIRRPISTRNLIIEMQAENITLQKEINPPERKKLIEILKE